MTPTRRIMSVRAHVAGALGRPRDIERHVHARRDKNAENRDVLVDAGRQPDADPGATGTSSRTAQRGGANRGGEFGVGQTAPAVVDRLLVRGGRARSRSSASTSLSDDPLDAGELVDVRRCDGCRCSVHRCEVRAVPDDEVVLYDQRVDVAGQEGPHGVGR